jgi:DNA ligase N terminus
MDDEKKEVDAAEAKCNDIPFASFCEVLNKVESIEFGPGIGKSKRKFDAIFTGEMKKKLNGHSLHPLLRLLLPVEDDRKYGLKQARICDAYVKALGLSKDGDTAKKLAQWNNVDQLGAVDRGASDFGFVLEEILEARISLRKSDWNLGRANEFLDRIAIAKPESAKFDLIGECKNSLSPNEQKWLMRIINKGLQLRINRKSIFSNLCGFAETRWSETQNLKSVCYEICMSQRQPTSSSSTPVSVSATISETSVIFHDNVFYV